MNDYLYEDELMHYGVLGMKWGVRRGKSQLAKARSTSDRDLHDRGVATLNKHKGKINKEVTRLDKNISSLQSRRNRQMQVDDVRAAKLSSKAAQINRKATRPFTSNARADRLMRKATLLNIKADAIKSNSQETQALINKNKARKDIFERGLSDIDRALTDSGKDFIKKNS